MRAVLSAKLFPQRLLPSVLSWRVTVRSLRIPPLPRLHLLKLYNSPAALRALAAGPNKDSEFSSSEP